MLISVNLGEDWGESNRKNSLSFEENILIVKSIVINVIMIHFLIDLHYDLWDEVEVDSLTDKIKDILSYGY